VAAPLRRRRVGLVDGFGLADDIGHVMFPFVESRAARDLTRAASVR
jgi:hypothetical protein